MIRSLEAQKSEHDITAWFHYRDLDGASPYQYVEYTVNQFCNDMARRGLNLDVSRQQVLYEMCSATCTMYYYEVWMRRGRFIVGAPKRQFSRPRQWSASLESMWKEYLQTRIAGREYWERFWGVLGHAYWETTITRDNWRDVMQYLLPLYIQRDTHTLLAGEDIAYHEHEDSRGDDVLGADDEADTNRQADKKKT
jgi:hypothetical protein